MYEEFRARHASFSGPVHGNCGPELIEAPERSVVATFRGLDQQIDEVAQAVAALVDRLNTAGVVRTGNYPDSSEVVSKASPLPCEMAQRLSNAQRRLNEMSLTIQQVLACLEL